MTTKLDLVAESDTLSCKGGILMPNKNPRVNVVLDRELYHTVYDLAQNRGISMSLLMRDLVKEAVEIQEDQALAAIAETREQSCDPHTALSHEEVWG